MKRWGLRGGQTYNKTIIRGTNFYNLLNALKLTLRLSFIYYIPFACECMYQLSCISDALFEWSVCWIGSESQAIIQQQRVRKEERYAISTLLICGISMYDLTIFHFCLVTRQPDQGVCTSQSVLHVYTYTYGFKKIQLFAFSRY